MVSDAHEIERRRKLALAAIKLSFGTEEAEYGANLFVEHHQDDEADGDYWQKHLGTRNPAPASILDILELRSHWSDDDEDGIQIFDFTLPDGATNYVISVRFDADGKVEEISMES